MKQWIRRLLTGSLLVALVACEQANTQSFPESPILPSVDPRLPVPLRPTPVSIVLQPKSARVEQGKPYPFGLYTHCGVDWGTDFDGSFWDWTGQPQLPSWLGNPVQGGTMTLIDANHARFDFEGSSIHFTRHVGPKISTYGCY